MRTFAWCFLIVFCILPLFSSIAPPSKVLFAFRTNSQAWKEKARSWQQRFLPSPGTASSSSTTTGQSVNHEIDSELDKAFLDDIDKDNALAMQVLEHIYHSNESWTFVGERMGVKVEKCFLHPGVFVSTKDASKGDKHACIKSSGIINAPPEKIFRLFLDNQRVKEYNDHCAQVRDLYHFPHGTRKAWSKLVYAVSPPYGPFKARDFCSVVHCERRGKHRYIIMNRPAYLHRHPPSHDYVRGTILLAGNIIEPCEEEGKSKLTMIAHVNPGGGADTATAAWLVNKLCARGPPDFIRKVEKAAQK
eukprot:gene9364-10339_t